ncbi:MAG: hypothetical protein HY824_06605 [Acidobacteria bacterium]|nr:hypothetical protein [Acidobacteriota bacterium]
MPPLSHRPLWLTLALHLLASPPVLAQQARPSAIAIDTNAAVDDTINAQGTIVTGFSIDAVASVALGRGIEAIVWPIAQRLSSGQWNRDLWIASLRYERSGRIGVRIDGGLIPAPVGLANLTVRRPHLNPLISQPVSLFTPLPPVEFQGPRANLMGGFYPYGTQVTLSGAHWDSRVAVMDTSPLRRRRIFSRTNPPRFANVVVGGGVTPVVGLRIGASLTHGGWERAGESPAATADRNATLVTIESEFSYAYTKLAGEWVRDTIETFAGDRVASGWYVQGQQTLAPRWFAAGRVERMSSPRALTALAIVEQQFNGTEEVLGFRLTPEITLRIAHRARRAFGRPGFDDQAAVSVVWWRRWM